MKLVFSPKQIHAFQTANAKVNIWVGAVRSGKTFSSLWALIRECHEAAPGDLVIIGKTSEAIERNVIAELLNKEAFKDVNVKYYSGKRRLMLEGRMIHCIGASDERAEGKIRGPTFSAAYVDEATLIPESFFKMLSSRLSYQLGERKKRLIATTNPDSPFHWLKKDYIDRCDEQDVRVFNFKMEDNPSLHPAYVSELKREYRGLWYKRFIDGEWCLAEGSVYDFFDEDVHVIDAPPSYAKYYIVGVDYGTANPCAFTLIGFNDDSHTKIWVQKEYYFDSRKEGYQKTDAEYADDFIEFLSDYPIRSVYIDPSAASFKLELRRKKPSLIIRDAENDVENGIRVVAMRLATGDLKICKSCNNLIKEFQSYVWDSKKAKLGIDAPKKEFDHLLDGTRYAIYTHWGDKRDLKEQSQEQREFERWKKMQQTLSPWAPPRAQGKPIHILRPK